MSADEKCFFCGSKCEIDTVPTKHTVKEDKCNYCGPYLLDDFFIASYHSRNNDKFKMACILNERRLKGMEGVALSDKTDKEKRIYGYPQMSFDELLNEFPKKPSEFLNRTLLNLSRLTKPEHPFENIRLELTTNKDYLHLFTRSIEAGYTFLRELADRGYIRFNRVQAGEQLDVFCLTTKCWEMVENLQQTDEIYDSSNGGKTSMEWDVFICHASEDKEGFVEPLVKDLQKNNINVWYDRFELKLGDSLREKIDEGLLKSRYGLVVLSNAFFAKDWPKTELDALITRQNSEGQKVILPIWHGVEYEDVSKFSPILAGRFAARSSEGITTIVEKIKDVLNDGSKVNANTKTEKPSVQRANSKSNRKQHASLTHKLPDQHHIQNLVSASEEKKFKKVKNMMPELITEFKTDLSTEDNKLIREFFVLPNNRVCLGRSEKPRLIYYEEEHKGLRNKIDILENQGFLIDVTPGNAPIYRMTEEFVELIIKYG